MGEHRNNCVGIYCRLSVDDGTSNESMSISNQKQFLTEYVNQKGWTLTRTYVDDGYSGTTFDRPDFQRMIRDIDNGEINVVIVKDLSRLGRNYILCGQYTEIYFVEKNVRFIAINDAIDSFHGSNDIAPFKNILNDMYAKDISTKVKTAIHAKARRGEYISGADPYGYMHDPADRKKLIINHEVALNVRKIFDLCLSGSGIRHIATILNKEGILTPSDYTRSKKQKTAFVPQKSWAPAVVRVILQNPVYAGRLVQCRKKTQSYRNHKVIENDKENWIVVENTHEPIIPPDEWERAQEALTQRRRTIIRREEPHLFSGLFFCADCGGAMYYHDRSRHDYFLCGKYSHLGAHACTNHYIRTAILKQTVLDDLRKNVRYTLEDEERAVRQIIETSTQSRLRGLTAMQEEFAANERRFEEASSLLKRVYEDNVSGKLSDQLFKQFSSEYQKEISQLEKRGKELKSELNKQKAASVDAARFVEAVRRYAELNELDRYVLNELIEKITIAERVGEDGSRSKTLHIHYRFAGENQCAMPLISRHPQ